METKYCSYYYHSQADREAYVKGYNECYVKGVEDGRNGNQFNIK
ncbi:MAG: hypothetical protein UDG28_09635 [Prevotellamassilia sp.]|nr:hypothetical protein [Prevotellamassilia sp.]